MAFIENNFRVHILRLASNENSRLYGSTLMSTVPHSNTTK